MGKENYISALDMKLVNKKQAYCWIVSETKVTVEVA